MLYTMYNNCLHQNFLFLGANQLTDEHYGGQVTSLGRPPLLAPLKFAYIAIMVHIGDEQFIVLDSQTNISPLEA